LLTFQSIDKIVRLLGQGTFGKVVEAESAKSFSKVAIKIIRAVPKYREASTIEIRVLKKLKEKDPINQ
jgi:dual-specificity kinase